MADRLLVVPSFIVAKSKKELVQAMVDNNLSKGFRFTYFDIQKDGKEWVAWYNVDIQDDMARQIPHKFESIGKQQ